MLALLATALLYGRFLWFGHISWDDPEMVFKNKAVREFNLSALFSNHYVGNYIPVTMFLHALNWALFGANDWGHHLINMLLHLLNGVLVYQLGRVLLKNNNVASIGALLFLLHPLQLESVGWISELKNILSTTFYLLSYLSYLRFSEIGKRNLYLQSLLLFVLAGLSKSSVVILPLLLIATDILLLNKKLSKSLINKLPYLLLALVFGVINIKTQTADLFINHSHEFAWYQRTGFAGYALLKYLLLFLFPFHLSVIYPYPALKAAPVVLGIFVWLLLFAVVYLLAKKQNKRWLFFMAFVLVNLILVLQFLPFGEVLYADRYAYLPVIGFAWMFGYLVEKLNLNFKWLGVCTLLVLGMIGFSRSRVWSSAITLYEDILKNYPNSFVALNSVGVEYMFRNEDRKSLDYFNRAVEAAPYNYKGFYNRGLLHIKNNKPELAIKNFNQALAIYQYPKAYVGRATAYYMLGDMAKAITDVNYVLEKEPNNVKAHFTLGNCYNEMNRLQDALKEYNKCIELNTDEAEYYFKRAIVYGKQQNFEASLNDLNLSIRLNPNLYEAYYWKGVAKVNLKQNGCEEFKLAAQHNFQPAITAFNNNCR
ncbi:MAG: tetratricopeptide repeat protein [Bacteroidia bacterium]|nr:tetratricopeptide repeat protein [Bacteroidia bacterium]